MKMNNTYWDIFKITAENPALKDRPAIIVKERQSCVEYTHEFLYQQSEKIRSKLILENGEIVGLLMNRTPLLPAIIAALHRCGSSFIILDPFRTSNELTIEELNISKIVTLKNENIYEGFESAVLLENKEEKNLFLWTKSSAERHKSSSIKKNGIAYFIKTSGSTGIAKIVGVIHECIMPNIKDFKSLWNVTPSDVIYFSTPLTFDPSIIELYLAAACGAALLISDPYEDLLFNKKYPITIWQTTPSKLARLTVDFLKYILNETSSLRILALGGEPFNCFDKLKVMKHANNKTEVYNLYGTTEVSCWASACKVSFDETSNNSNLSLGAPLSDTLLKVVDCHKHTVSDGMGEIHIGSKTRRCFVGSEVFEILGEKCLHTKDACEPSNDQILWRETGDIAETLDGKIYFKGRSDKVIKRYGIRVNLVEIEQIALSFPCITQCSCIWDSKTNVIILFYSSNKTKGIINEDLGQYLKTNLDKYSMPDDILEIPEIPVNSHGKVAEKKLLNMYKTVNKKYENLNPADLFNKLLNDFLPVETPSNGMNTKSFLDCGGTSIIAILLVNKMERLTTCKYPELLADLLNTSLSFINIMSNLNCKNYSNFTNQETVSNDTYENELYMNNKRLKMVEDSTLLPLNLTIEWKFNLEKCIDANPVIYLNRSGLECILVGSHSGNVAALNAISGVPYEVFNVSSRVEAPFICFEANSLPFGVVGCYDGFLWCFSLPKLVVEWKICLNAMIKSQACFFDNNIYAATYEGIIWTICSTTGKIITNLQVGKKGISADLLCSMKGFIYVTTLDGICCCVCLDGNNLKLKWRKQFSSPIFTKAAFLKGESEVVFSEVDRKIHCLNAHSGDLLWKFETGGPIFSSCIIQRQGEKYYISFGCHDHHIYTLVYSETSNKSSLLSKIHLCAQVYATPCIYDDKTVVCACTDGTVYLCDVFSGNIKGRYSLPSQVYSSPLVFQTLVYAGCRDNYLYCIKIQES